MVVPRYHVSLQYLADEHFEKDKIDFEVLIQFLHGRPIKPLLVKQILDDSIKLFWNFLFLTSQCHLSTFTLSSIPFIIKFSPSPNLINEKGILHDIKSIKKFNSFLNSNGFVLLLSFSFISKQALSLVIFLFKFVIFILPKLFLEFLFLINICWKINKFNKIILKKR